MRSKKKKQRKRSNYKHYAYSCAHCVHVYVCSLCVEIHVSLNNSHKFATNNKRYGRSGFTIDVCLCVLLMEHWELFSFYFTLTDIIIIGQLEIICVWHDEIRLLIICDCYWSVLHVFFFHVCVCVYFICWR